MSKSGLFHIKAIDLPLVHIGNNPSFDFEGAGKLTIVHSKFVVQNQPFLDLVDTRLSYSVHLGNLGRDEVAHIMVAHCLLHCSDLDSKLAEEEGLHVGIQVTRCLSVFVVADFQG